MVSLGQRVQYLRNGLLKMENNIHIKVSTGSDDCECCGYISYEDVEVSLNGEVKFSHSGDDHLSGNLWYEWQTPVKDILTALGYSVTFEESYDDDDE